MYEEDPSYHMAGVPRLLNQYYNATANTYGPDNEAALHLLSEIIGRCQKAKQIIGGRRSKHEPQKR